MHLAPGVEGDIRVFELAWAFVAHTDSHFDPETLARFIAGYLRVQPLTIGELWAVAIMGRIVLIENLRRLYRSSEHRVKRTDADQLANRARRILRSTMTSRCARRDLSEVFAAHEHDICIHVVKK